jgi:hypothetical protein
MAACAVEPMPPAAPVTSMVSWDMIFSLLSSKMNNKHKRCHTLNHEGYQVRESEPPRNVPDERDEIRFDDSDSMV